MLCVGVGVCAFNCGCVHACMHEKNCIIDAFLPHSPSLPPFLSLQSENPNIRDFEASLTHLRRSHNFEKVLFACMVTKVGMREGEGEGRGGREGGREGGRVGGRVGGREGGREGGKERGREGGRERGEERGMERGMERGRQRGMERGRKGTREKERMYIHHYHIRSHMYITQSSMYMVIQCHYT